MTVHLPGAHLPRPIYSGLLPVTSNVPLQYEIGLAGRGFFVDPTKFQYQTLPQLRQAFDQGAEPGGQSRDTAGVWFRYQQTWEHGAGQTHFDRADSDRHRFRASKGIDPWTPGRLRLLPEVEQVDPAVATNLQLLDTNGKIWKVEGNTLAYSSTGAVGTWVAVALTAIGASITGITTDGVYVYVCDGTGVWQVSIAAPAGAAAWSTVDTTELWFANGRLLAANNNVLNELTSAGVITGASPLATLVAGSTWNAATAATNGIYLASTGGNVSQLWYIGVNSATGALTVPVVASAWLRGEVINCLGFYGQLLLIGTDKGFRVATISTNFVDYGTAVLIPGGVNAFAFEDRFAWFTWTNYDATSTGTGRIDLSALATPDGLLFAYATDLLAEVAGTVTTVCRYADTTFFGVSGHGCYRGSDDLVATGQLWAGQVAYNDVEDKLFLGIRVEHEPLEGSVAVDGLLPSGATSDGGTSDLDDSTRSDPFTFSSDKVPWLEPHLTLARDDADTTAGPVVTLWQLRAMPTGTRPENIQLPLVVEASVENRAFDPLEVRAWLRELQAADEPVLLQLGSENLTVVIASIGMDGLTKWTGVDGRVGMAGIILVHVTSLEAS